MSRTPRICTLMTSAARPAAAMLIAVAGYGVYAQTAPDPVEREMEFVDKLADATDLYNASQYSDALVAFQSLVQSYPDLDTDGYATLGLGDCLAALGRVAEARRVYESAMTPDPRRQEAIRNRLEELLLKGPITDAALDQLRTATQDPATSRFTSAWRLARAIQKQAAERLAEAAEAFRTAAKAPGEKPCSSQQLTNQAIYLDELLDDLKFLIDEIEGHLNMPRRIGPGPDGENTEPRTQELRLEQVLKMPNGRQVRIEIQQHEGSDLSVQIDGNCVSLTAAEQQLLRRHQDRCSAIILKAANRPPTAAPKAGGK